MGAPDANISIYNKLIALNSGSTNILQVDNLNNQIILKEHDLIIKSTIKGDINMGGNKITNVATPTDATGLTNKGYVDEFFQ